MNMLRLFCLDSRSTRPFQARRRQPLVESLEGRQMLSGIVGNHIGSPMVSVDAIQGNHIGTSVSVDAIQGNHIGTSVSVDAIQGNHIG